VIKDDKDEKDLDGPSPIHILDVHSIHQMGVVVNYIQVMGIKVIHIPAGCTNLFPHQCGYKQIAKECDA
jgi:hypothetical protein